MRNDQSFNLGAAALIAVIVGGLFLLKPLGVTTDSQAFRLFLANWKLLLIAVLVGFAIAHILRRKK